MNPLCTEVGGTLYGPPGFLGWSAVILNSNNNQTRDRRKVHLTVVFLGQPIVLAGYVRILASWCSFFGPLHAFLSLRIGTCRTPVGQAQALQASRPGALQPNPKMKAGNVEIRSLARTGCNSSHLPSESDNPRAPKTFHSRQAY